MQSLQISKVPEPSTLRSACDDQHELDSQLQRRAFSTKGSYTRLQTATLTSEIRCTCGTQGRSQKTQFSSGPFFLLAKFFALHDQECPLYRLSDRTSTFQTRINFYAGVVNVCILATMSVTQGAGGLSISPRLGFRNIVHAGSPAMALLGDVMLLPDDLMMSNMSPDFLHAVMRQLERLFAEGKAAPTDVDTQGRSLLHVSQHNDYYISRISIPT